MKEEQGMVDLLEYALKIGERKYDEERDREDALISQASQMQTVFSIVTAVLLGAAAIFADHRGTFLRYSLLFPSPLSLRLLELV